MRVSVRVNERAKVSGCVWGLGGFTIKLLPLLWSWWVIFPFLALPSFVLRAPELKHARRVTGCSAYTVFTFHLFLIN